MADKYYTLNEFIETLQKEIAHLSAYIQMISHISAREVFSLGEGIDYHDITNSQVTLFLVDADTNLAEIETKLTVASNGEVDFTKYALEVRVGAIIQATGAGVGGNYHHAAIDLVPFTTWRINSLDAEDAIVDAFDSASPATGITGLFLIDDQVEISGIGNPFLEGIFTSTSEESEFIRLAETNDPEAVVIADVFNVIVRLRER